MPSRLSSEMILDSLEENIFIKDMDLKYIFANTTYKKLVANNCSDIINKDDYEVFSKDSADSFTQDDRNVIKNEEVIDKVESVLIGSKTYILRIIKKPFYVDGKVEGILGQFFNIQQGDEKLIHSLAYFDSLTKLPNRILFEERVNSKISSLKRNKKKMAILFIDMDNFKQINDSYGHAAGDKFLIKVSKYIKKFLREQDTLARLGGDEFTVLLDDINLISDIVPIVNRIVNKFNKAVIIDGNELYSGVSIGISIYPDDATTYEGLLKASDTAMYKVKESGKNGFQFYKKSMQEIITLKMLIEEDLRSAIINNELFLEYQPKVDMETNKVYGMEALIRWRHEEMGLMKPDKFIEIAENTGQIYEIGLWVIHRAVSDTKSMHEQNQKLTVSINISSRQLENRNFITDVCKIVESIDLDSSFVELEITEGNIMNNIDVATKSLGILDSKGFKISIDDFGTGYSSLSYLRKLPAKTIKIDRSFIHDMDVDADDRSIVEAIISMGKSLGKEVVAEGSETTKHIEALKYLNCYKVQGYYFSKPLPIEIFKKYVETNNIED